MNMGQSEQQISISTDKEKFNFYKTLETEEIFVAYYNSQKDCFVLWGKGRKNCLALSVPFFEKNLVPVNKD